MKKQMIVAGLLAMSGGLAAQGWTVAGANVFKTAAGGNVGIGTGAAPIMKLQILTNNGANDGIHMNNTGTGNTGIYMRNSMAGQEWGINNTGTASGLGGGHFVLNNNSGDQFFISGTTGHVGLGGNTSPAYALDINTTVNAGGIRLNQNGSGTCALHLYNSGPSTEWTINSAITGNLQVQSNGTDRFMVDVNGNFGINTTSPGSRLDVNDQNSSAGSGSNFNYSTGSTAGGSAIVASASDVGTTASQQNIGVDGYGNCGAVGTSNAVGIRGSAAGGNTNYGGYFKTSGPSASARTIGVYGILASNNSAMNAAVYGDANGYTGATTFAGYFDGDIMVTGTPYSTGGGPFTASDRRFKKDIRQLDNALEKICKLNAYTYKFKTEEYKDMNFSDREQLGFIAQELNEVFPQMVQTGLGGYNFVNYTAMVPVLLEALKEQKQNTDAMKAELQKQLDEQKQLINELMAKTGGATGIDQTGATSGFSMGQNEPNPFSTETAIKYNLPQTVSSAYVAVYDLSGKQITTFPIERKGQSSMTITSAQLAAGIYIYSIVADGKVMDSKKMIVADK